MESECLDYRRLPGQNPLFLDYLFDFPKVARYYRKIPLTADQWTDRAALVRSRHSFSRDSLATMLERTNRDWAGEEVLKNLRRLASTDGVAVVTGQQVGLWGGPAYTIYKAATAVAYARRLSQMGLEAVPVFWMAADDSDFEEVRESVWLDPQGRLHTVRHPDDRQSAQQMAGLASVVDLDAEYESLSQITDGLDFGAATVARLRRNYRAGRSFKEAFAGWLGRLFRSHGLLIFDSLTTDFRRQSGPFYLPIVQQRERVLELLEERNQALVQDGFVPQVKTDDQETLLFWIDEGRRFKLRLVNGRYQAKGRKRLTFSQRELGEIVRNEPERLGFNALLRPLVQDQLFPTIAYIGGPGEVAYFAQVNALAPAWKLDPVIIPRAGFTLVDRRCQRILKRNRLKAVDIILQSVADLTEGVLRGTRSAAVLDEFDEMQRSFDQRLQRIAQGLDELDPPLVQMLNNSKSKMEYQLSKVRDRFLENQRLRQPALERHLRHLKNSLNPGGRLQERTLSFNQFLAAEGPGLIDRLVDRISPDCSSHQIVAL